MGTENGGIKKITEHYSLKTPYLLDPKNVKEHRMFMAPRMITENQSLEQHMKFFETDLMSDITPKRIYVGDPGNGKSHLLLHVSDSLESNSFVYYHVECPALGKGTKPIVIFTELLNELGGKNRVLDIIFKAFKECRRQAVSEKPDAFVEETDKTLEPYLNKVFEDNQDLIDFAKLAIDKEENRTKFWIWLNGGKGGEVTNTNLKDESAALVRTFKSIFSIYERAEGKKLLVIFDELDKGRILGPEASEAWKELFRQICDPNQRHAGILMAVTPETFNSNAVIDGSVESRVSGLNVILLTKMNDKEQIQKFVKEIVAWNRMEGFDVQKRIDEFASELDNENVTLPTYPFTNEAIQEIGDTYSDSVPRDILGALNRACAMAQQGGKHFVTLEYISKLKPDDLSDIPTSE